MASKNTDATKLRKIAKAQQNSKAAKAIDPKKVFAPIEPEDNETGSFLCSCCGTVYTKRSYFLKTNSLLYAANKGWTTVCKSCVDKYFQQLLELYSGNEQHAAEHVCWLFDLYYTPEVVAMTKNMAKDRKFTGYTSKMNMAQIRKKEQAI